MYDISAQHSADEWAFYYHKMMIGHKEEFWWVSGLQLLCLGEFTSKLNGFTLDVKGHSSIMGKLLYDWWRRQTEQLSCLPCNQIKTFVEREFLGCLSAFMETVNLQMRENTREWWHTV